MKVILYKQSFLNRFQGFSKSLFISLILCAVQIVGYGQYNYTSGIFKGYADEPINIDITPIPSKSFFASIANPGIVSEQLTTGLINNEIKLDSICEYETTGWQQFLKKYYFHYENGQLRSKECIHFKTSWDDTLDTKEIWTYNDQNQLEQYRKLKAISVWNDKVIVEDEMNYIYEDGLLIEKQVKLLDFIVYSQGRYNGVMRYPGEILYNMYTLTYKYNEAGRLIEWTDYDFIPAIYINDSLGRLQYVIEEYFVYKYSYEYTDTSKIIYRSWKMITDPNVDVNSLTDWEASLAYYYILDQFGRDSIFFYSYKNDFREISTFQYTPANQLKVMDAIIYEIGIDTIYGQIEWLYSDDGHLLEYRKHYFDKRYYEWMPQHKLEYYFSSIKSEYLPAEDSKTIIGIYPNPTTDILSFEGIGSEYEYSIFTVYGREMQKGILINRQLRVSELPKGIYLLRLKNKETNNTFRFFKE